VLDRRWVYQIVDEVYTDEFVAEEIDRRIMELIEKEAASRLIVWDWPKRT
jgi:hypothetical protein